MACLIIAPALQELHVINVSTSMVESYMYRSPIYIYNLVM